jgi:flagellar hook-associated protein 1 FlgK
MSGLLSSLDSSVQALNSQSYAISIAGQNVANLDNPNYADESAVLGTVGGGSGVNVEGVTSSRNALLDAQVAAQTSIASSLTTQQQYLQTAQSVLGENLKNTSSSSSSTSTTTSTGTTGLSSDLDAFFNTFGSLAASPTSTAEKQAVVQQGAILTNDFQQTDANLAQVQSDLTSEAQSSVTDANQQLQTIASLNGQIMAMGATGAGSTAQLRDEREAAVEKLAVDIPITTTAKPDGSIQVSVSDTSHNAVVLVSGITVTGPVAISGGTISGGASASTLQISSGSIYGALDARDGAIQTLRNSLDSLASQIVTSVNAAYNPTSAAGGNFFNPAGTTAATINLSSSLSATNLTAGTGAAGDNTIALAVAGVANQQFSTAGGDAIDGTIDQYYSGAVTDLGQTLSNVNNEVTNQNALLNLVTSQRDSVSGVSMDQEMGNLMKYQSAYQASARVFSTIDVLLNTLINNTGTP